MIIAEYVLAWSFLIVWIYLGGRLLMGASEERFACGLFAAPRAEDSQW